ncbi:NAD(P)-dependent dehydrogenase (short-subunit alcohol dehydrogenase family) [Hephaestia caeni]|uniref:NAD(P)-dependent dehydrogenase (Short-subunit alcohol dehydrogenase family) n=1 Tax=Hephaestia caeni TaxID=645617 RepID=A0A397NQW5_9SPHN|nr:SDR family NAD(P)-dependent oxidoreductase [Hephaestia caeni]RIA37155.1 NAD(P)-dependent dehydrogenase (short-subunit alcohol dehydrogenase family) [Hephaestia caeni]
MTDTRLMEGKVAVVTGAGNGIGRAIAVMMAAHGAKVIINDIGVSLTGEGGSASPAEETRDAIRAAGGEAAISTDSVADPESAKKIVQCALDNFGRIDAVVNNAGILRDSIFHKMTADDWKSVVDVHLNGSFYVASAAAQHFRQQESGAFVFMVSASGLIGAFGQANYAAAKLGMTALSKSIAIDMKRYNVRSNCISPVAWSRMVSSIPTDTPEQKARVEKMMQITPEKNAPLAVYLASDRAAHVSGQVFGVRKNEIYLYNQFDLARVVADVDGWTPNSIADVAMPGLAAGFREPVTAAGVFPWEPI